MLYKLNSKTTALLVIDAQNEYLESMGALFLPHATATLEKINAIIEKANKFGIKVAYIQHKHNADGHDVGRMGDFDSTPIFIDGAKGSELFGNLKIVNGQFFTKNRYSSFTNPKLTDFLKKNNIDTIIVVGFMTSFCCFSTAISASDLDYKTVFVADAVNGPSLPDLGFGEISHETVRCVVATSLAFGVADVCSTEELLDNIK